LSSPPAPFLCEQLEALRSLGEGEILDLACGAGRNALYLARALQDSELRVAACDRDREALAALDREAGARGLSVRSFLCELEESSNPLPQGAYAAIIVFRYLHRPLMPSLRAAVRPGGLVLYETFTREQRQFGRPRRDAFLLEAGELPGLFPGWELIEHWEGVLDEPKSALARVLVRRPVSL